MVNGERQKLNTSEDAEYENNFAWNNLSILKFGSVILTELIDLNSAKNTILVDLFRKYVNVPIFMYFKLAKYLLPFFFHAKSIRIKDRRCESAVFGHENPPTTQEGGEARKRKIQHRVDVLAITGKNWISIWTAHRIQINRIKVEQCWWLFQNPQ